MKDLPFSVFTIPGFFVRCPTKSEIGRALSGFPALIVAFIT
jgi:hypothetical protein